MPPLAFGAGDPRPLAAAYIAKMGPAIQGQHGDDHTYKVACALVVDFDLAMDVALELIRAWNETCQPPWSERDLVQKLQNADKYGRHARGAKLTDEPPARDPDAAYDVAVYCAFLAAPEVELHQALATLDAALNWTGALRKVDPVERQAALLLALYAEGRVERGPDRVPWLMAQAAREHFACKPSSAAKRDEVRFTLASIDVRATPNGRNGHARAVSLPTDGESVAARRCVSPCAQLPEDPEVICARAELEQQFRATLSPLEQRVFDQPLSDSERDVAARVGTTWKTVKSTRQRIRKKAREWANGQDGRGVA